MRVTFGLRLDERQGPADRAYFMAPQVGRQGFLGLLETYLGLSGPEVPHAARVAAYLGFLVKANDGRRFYSRSLKADDVGTAAVLLQWREEWYLAGWAGNALDTSPKKIQDMAAVEALAAGGMSPGEGERLNQVAQMLRAGNRIPVASVQLVEDLALYPFAWRQVLGLLEVNAALPMTVTAEGDLGRLQGVVLNAVEAGRVAETFELAGDGSFRVVQARSCEVAEHWLSAICRAEETDRLVLCEEGGDALDATLSATGGSACGFGAPSDLRPALQTLGLALETCWTPVDVPRTMEFLVHPISPLGFSAGRALARALADKPGIGSDSWEAAKAVIAETEKGKEVLEDVAFWLEGDRWTREEGAPVGHLATRAVRICDLLTRFALASGDEATGASPAIGQCKAVIAGLDEFQRQGIERLGPRQIEQLLAESTPGGAINPHAISQVGCLKSAVTAAVCGIESVAEVVWWMPSTPALPHPHPWSQADVAALGMLGLELRDPAAELASLSKQWLRPILAATKRFVLVLPPPGREEHPIWQLIKQLAPGVSVDSIDHALHNLELAELAPAVTRVALAAADRYIELGRPITSRREKQSFSNLNDIFNNPALAVLKDVASLRTGTVLTVAEGNQLLGTLGHRVVEKLFQQPGALAWSAEQATAWFNDMVDPLLTAEGAPLLMPGESLKLHRFKHICRKAVCTLLAHLQRAGALRVRTELELDGTFAGHPFVAKLDMLVDLPEDRTALLDLKWSRAKNYKDVLRTGRYLQLALYAGVVREHFKALPATVGYFIFDGAELLVTQDGVFPNETVVAAKSGVPASLEAILALAIATWKWRQAQWAEGKVEWVDKRFGKLAELGEAGTLALEEVGRYDGDHLALLGAWEE
ncbi:PD-(D/E)XK nuclease family protein [Variovorax boronicumulans]|uniref:PD-(D/E)XK nuclease family protein n=1 Tax=Variovorax boronicumulans TaxID=436515 RepID=UPI000B2690BD|nr:PD-(D/E)XK nuclease family protein [Variovorax boronicumulans]